MQIRAEVRDKSYNPAADAEASADIVTPSGSSVTVPLRPDPLSRGIYTADWDASTPGSYIAEVKATRNREKLGSDILPFQREDGVAEHFHRQQNRDLLQSLAAETGGRYYTPSQAERLPEEISFSEAGIAARETKELWNMPIVFLVLLALRSAEWLLRRRWGLV
jgi:hypothetical protein